MKKFFMILVSTFCVLFCVNFEISAKKKTILVTPSTAKIYVNGSEVGTGTYELNMKGEIAILKFEAPGYYTKEIRLLKDDPRKTIAYTMEVDEAEANSIGGEAALSSNKWINISVKKGMTEDQVWKRLITAVGRHFEDIEVRDKLGGNIRTQWVERKFSSVTVRTRLEIRADFSQDALGYQARLSSEIKQSNFNNEGYEKYDRVLKKYENTIAEIQAAVAGGE